MLSPGSMPSINFMRSCRILVLLRPFSSLQSRGFLCSLSKRINHYFSTSQKPKSKADNFSKAQNSYLSKVDIKSSQDCTSQTPPHAVLLDLFYLQR
jgi:hypothetical protein